MSQTHTSSADSVFTGAPPESFGFKRIIYAKSGFTSTITINRPDVLNCIVSLTLKELGTAFLDSSEDNNVAVVIITGAGNKAF